MEQQYKTDSEIYAVLEREIIDLTLRPGCSLSENPLCTRFGAPRSLIRVVLQRLQENGLVKIVPYKRHYCHPAEPGHRGRADL